MSLNYTEKAEKYKQGKRSPKLVKSINDLVVVQMSDNVQLSSEIKNM